MIRRLSAVGPSDMMRSAAAPDGASLCGGSVTKKLERVPPDPPCLGEALRRRSIMRLSLILVCLGRWNTTARVRRKYQFLYEDF
jgi:hypothetical protein